MRYAIIKFSKKRMGKYFTLIIVLILSFKFALAQENHSEHTIQKGESVYMISKKYGVSVDAIFKLNPGSENVIYAGEILHIPNPSTTATTPTSTSSTTEITDTKITNYQVKPGETKFGLSKRFGVSIATLEQQNPHIVSMLQAGHIINLDKTNEEKANAIKEGQHQVVKGETLWGISQKYGITVTQLTAANANQLSEFLQIGQILTVPDKDSKIVVEGEYIVERGDTKFQLAKRFNMTIAELEEKNPHIVDMLMAGHKLNTKHSSDAAEQTKVQEDITDVQEEEETNPTENTVPTSEVTTTTDGYKDYVIQPKETLFSLSKKAGMTINDFTSLNPKLLKSVNAGDIIKMPTTIAQTSTSSETTTRATPTKDVSANKNSALYADLVKDKSHGLYFYTPFSSEELGSPEQRQRMVESNAEFQKYIDFFQGAQIAIDSAKALDLNFDVTLIKKNIARSELAIESPHEKNAILIPFLENPTHYPSITSNAAISIIDIQSNIDSKAGNKVYKSVPSEEFQKTKTLHHLLKQDAQIIVVSDLVEANNKEFILNTIPDAKFLKVDKAGFFESNTLEKALDKNKINYIILDSEKTIVFLNSTTSLMSKLADFNIQLVIIEPALMPNQREVSDMRYRILQLIFPSISNPQNNKGARNFEVNYEDVFGLKPSKESVLGHDITLDVLLRLSQNSSFENTIKTIKSEYPHLKFEYIKTNDSNYSNNGVYLMQYNSNEGMSELE